MRDDQAETVLMRLLRGAERPGWPRWPSAGRSRLIRPMLSMSRARDSSTTSMRRAIPFVEDSSNSSPRFLRNRMRDELLPMLERDYAPGLRRRLVEVADEMRALDDLVDGDGARANWTRLRVGGGVLDVSGFGAVHRAVQRGCIRLFVARADGIAAPTFARACRGDAQLCLDRRAERLSRSAGRMARRARVQSLLRIARAMTPAATARAEFSVAARRRRQSTMVERRDSSFEASTIARGQRADAGQSLSSHCSTRRKSPKPDLVVRNFMPGDRIRPLGMTGTRKVKDVFIDRKLPRSRRARFPLVTLGGEDRVDSGSGARPRALVSKVDRNRTARRGVVKSPVACHSLRGN